MLYRDSVFVTSLIQVFRGRPLALRPPNLVFYASWARWWTGSLVRCPNHFILCCWIWWWMLFVPTTSLILVLGIMSLLVLLTSFLKRLVSKARPGHPEAFLVTQGSGETETETGLASRRWMCSCYRKQTKTKTKTKKKNKKKQPMFRHSMKCAVTFERDMKFTTDCTKKHCCYMPSSVAFGVMTVLAARGSDVRCTFAACSLTSVSALVSVG